MFRCSCAHCAFGGTLPSDRLRVFILSCVVALECSPPKKQIQSYSTDMLDTVPKKN